MELIAKKPCSYHGRQFFIGEKIPRDFVIDPEYQEKLGVIAIVGTQDSGSSTKRANEFTEEEAQNMVLQAVAEAESRKDAQIAELQEKLDALQQMRTGVVEIESVDNSHSICITVHGEGQEGVGMFLSPEEIEQIFYIMQLNAEDGARAMSEVTSKKVLILLQAADSRKTIKNAAKEQACKLFPMEEQEEKSESGKGMKDGVERADV